MVKAGKLWNNLRWEHPSVTGEETIEAGRGCWRSHSKKLSQVSQSCSLRAEVCNISTPFGQAFPGVTHPPSKKGVSCIRMKFIMFWFVPVDPVLSLGVTEHSLVQVLSKCFP